MKDGRSTGKKETRGDRTMASGDMTPGYDKHSDRSGDRGFCVRRKDISQMNVQKISRSSQI